MSTADAQAPATRAGRTDRDPVRSLKNLQWAMAALAVVDLLVGASQGEHWLGDLPYVLPLWLAAILLESGTRLGLLLAALLNVRQLALIALMLVSLVMDGLQALGGNARDALESTTLAAVCLALQAAWWRLAVTRWPALRAHFFQPARVRPGSSRGWQRVLLALLAMQWLALLALVVGAALRGAAWGDAMGTAGFLVAPVTAPVTLIGGLLTRRPSGRLMWPVSLLGAVALLLSAAVVALAYARWG
jgi:hypothetical protein